MIIMRNFFFWNWDKMYCALKKNWDLYYMYKLKNHLSEQITTFLSHLKQLIFKNVLSPPDPTPIFHWPPYFRRYCRRSDRHPTSQLPNIYDLDDFGTQVNFRKNRLMPISDRRGSETVRFSKLAFIFHFGSSCPWRATWFVGFDFIFSLLLLGNDVLLRIPWNLKRLGVFGIWNLISVATSATSVPRLCYNQSGTWSSARRGRLLATQQDST